MSFYVVWVSGCYIRMSYYFIASRALLLLYLSLYGEEEEGNMWPIRVLRSSSSTTSRKEAEQVVEETRKAGKR